MKRLWHSLAVSLVVLLLCWRIAGAFSSDQRATYPAQPIHVVVPYGAGGGTDNFVRLLAKTIADNELLPQPTSSSTWWAAAPSVVREGCSPDGYRILCHHESIITAKSPGAVSFGPRAFEPIAQTGGINLFVVVREDAPYQSVRDLLEAAKQEPRTLRFGRTRSRLTYHHETRGRLSRRAVQSSPRAVARNALYLCVSRGRYFLAC